MAQDKPSKTYPLPPATAPTSTPSPMPPQIPDPSYLGVSFDQLLAQRGVRVIHSRAMPCPNLQTVDGNGHVPGCEFCDGNGFLQYDEREIWATFSGNSMQKTFEAHGVWEQGSAVMSFPTEYPDGTEADFQTFDRLYIPDFTVRLWETKEYEPRTDYIQSLRYPVQKVDKASAIVNGVQVFYLLGTDFNVTENGDIEWISGKEPAYDSETGHGTPISWAYYAQSVYYVVQTLRELRITQEMSVAGIKTAKRLPQQVLVKRDFLPRRGETVENP